MVNRLNTPNDLLFYALLKDGERYVLTFPVNNAELRAEALRCLGRWASNPELSFTWYDAAVMSQKIRQGANAAA